MYLFFFFFFKQKTAYEMRISDWSSDVCSSDLSSDAAGSRHSRDTFSGSSAPRYWRPGSARRQAARDWSADRESAASRSPASVSSTARWDRQENRWSEMPAAIRSEESRVGKEWVSTCRSGWSAEQYKNKMRTKSTPGTEQQA